MSEHFFEADAAIIARLGRELVAKQETALVELIKNSFDADATDVSVVFTTDQSVPAMEIRDNGVGMTKDGLINGFLRLASDNKITEPFSVIYHRRRAGRKGIGRFSAHRLGDHLVLTTRSMNESTGWRLEVNWTKFSRGASLSTVPVTITPVDVPEHGTVLRIENLYDEWSDATVKRCWRNVIRLQQPFPVAPVQTKDVIDPGFLVKFVRENVLFKDETVIADLNSELFDHMHAVIEYKVDDQGHAQWRISKNRFAPTSDWRQINTYYPEESSPPPYTHLKNVWMQAHYAILAPDLLPSLVYGRIRDELRDYGGIRLYRNGFRVVPYGEPDNDWLRLDETYAKRSFLAPISNRNFFGVVEVRDPEGLAFEEHTSREGLLESPAFLELKHLTSAVLITAVGAISDARGKKTRASDKKTDSAGEKENLKSVIDELVAATSEISCATGVPQQAREDVSAAAEKVVAIAAAMSENVTIAKTQLADETAILRFLASLGMTTAEFSHETGMTFDAFRFDFEKIFSAAVDANTGNEKFISRADRAKNMLVRLDTLTAYLNTLASSRSARDIHPVSLSKIVEEFIAGIKLQAETQQIVLTVQVPHYDPLYTAPMHEAEIASLLLNLYTNSVKAVKRRGGVRNISIKVNHSETEQMHSLIFSDSGDGVPPENRERIFDAFFTTRIAAPGQAGDNEHVKGTGLGLWIVSQIVTNAGGSIAVIDPEPGFATSFEILLPKEKDNDC